MNDRDRLPITPIRDLYHQTGIDAYTLAQRLGWYDVRGGVAQPATSRLQRILGIRAQSGGRCWTGHADTIAISKAREICDALGTDFDELYDTELAALAAAGGPSPRCGRCNAPMMQPAQMCQFCVEEIALEMADAA
jgi:hypothetical protein